MRATSPLTIPMRITSANSVMRQSSLHILRCAPPGNSRNRDPAKARCCSRDISTRIRQHSARRSCRILLVDRQDMPWLRCGCRIEHGGDQLTIDSCPGVSDLRGELVTQPLVERPKQRVPDHAEVVIIDSTIGVAPADHLHQGPDSIQPAQSVHGRIYYLDELRALLAHVASEQATERRIRLEESLAEKPRRDCFYGQYLAPGGLNGMDVFGCHGPAPGDESLLLKRMPRSVLN